MSVEINPIKRKLSQLDDSAEGHNRIDPSESELCARCVALRLEDALGRIEYPEEYTRETFDVKIADVGVYYRQLSDHRCELCRILSASRVTVDHLPGEPQDGENADELHAFSLSDDLSWVGSHSSRDKLLRRQTSLYLAVVPSGFSRRGYGRNKHPLVLQGERSGFLVICRRGNPKPRIYASEFVSSLFDLSLARHWLQYCKDNHKRLCCRRNKVTTDFHLIDCHSLKVIPAPDQVDYTALSYVWGQPSIEANPSENHGVPGPEGIPLPSSLPAVIVDAISVTTGLGFQYLWVDRYCINQDSHSKHQQINQMDAIYQNAELTIVAAAGDGPEHGLPGINTKPRCRQQTCRVGGFDLISTMRHPHGAIQSSKWSSRGWTFQEAALSRRNLCFTDEQVYFECNAMNCHESLSSDLDLLHVKNKSKFREVLEVGLFGRNENQRYGHFDESTIRPAHNLVRFMGMGEQYTARDLAYDTDSLNAFTGIIRKFETAERGLLQIWGVPFCRGEREEQKRESFLDGLGWNHKVTDCDDRGHPRRRLDFPSWSWAGWAGEIQYEGRLSSFVDSPRQLDGEVKFVSIETGSGQEIGLSAYVDQAKTFQVTGPPAIHIRALVLPASAFSYDTSTTRSSLQIFNYPARPALSTGPWDASCFCQSLQHTDQRKCIYFGSVIRMVVIMVLEAQDKGWSRVGLIFLDEVWRWHFNASWTKFKGTKSNVRSVYRSGDIGEEFTSFRII